MDEGEKKAIASNGLWHAVNSVVSVAATLIALRTGFIDMEISQSSAAYTRMEALELRVDALRKELNERNMLVIELRTALASNHDPMDTLYRYLESMDVPAWLKQYDPVDNHFHMLYLNHEYERFYDVSMENYVGKTDFDIYPEDVAERYAAHDRAVYENKTFMRFIEYGRTASTGARMVPGVFWKFYVRLADGRELIAGIQLVGASGL